jgi:hypothetical protein
MPELSAMLRTSAVVIQSQPSRCAFCGEPFPFVGSRARSWRVGNRYACNEFCAEEEADREELRWQMKWECRNVED